MNRNPEYWAEKLEMLPHPEGGWYKETYRSSEELDAEGFSGSRNLKTGIYFLLTSENFSAFHRIKSDEMWHFYFGDGLNIHEINQAGDHIVHKLGLDVENGEQPQLVIPANSWFASEVREGGEFCLVGCTVAPGFDFQDFELAERQKLVQELPDHREVITRLTR